MSGLQHYLFRFVKKKKKNVNWKNFSFHSHGKSTKCEKSTKVLASTRLWTPGLEAHILLAFYLYLKFKNIPKISSLQTYNRFVSFLGDVDILDN